ncbi:MAG: M24 family metallopeptidase [Candidatus Hodarchaeales archaeon]
MDSVDIEQENYMEVPIAEISRRQEKIRVLIRKQNHQGVILFSLQEIFYYTGIALDGAVFIPSNGEDAVFFVKRNKKLADRYAKSVTVKTFGRLSKFFQQEEYRGIKGSIALELDLIPFSMASYLNKLASANGMNIVDGSAILRGIRSVKSKYEQDLIRKSAKIIEESFSYCIDVVKPGMTEIELSTLLDSWLLRNGLAGRVVTRSFGSSMPIYSFVISTGSAELNSFFSPVSGEGLSLSLPFGPSRRKIRKNEPFYVDTAGNYNGYISDQTRTFVIGRLDRRTGELFNALQEVKQFTEQRLKADCSLSNLYFEVYDLAEELGINDYFMGYKKDKVPFLGHGVGLELDDLPVFYSKGPVLEEGNVLAFEPKLVEPGRLLLGLEDTYIINSGGNEKLNNFQDLVEIS